MPGLIWWEIQMARTVNVSHHFVVGSLIELALAGLCNSLTFTCMECIAIAMELMCMISESTHKQFYHQLCTDVSSSYT